MGNCSLANQGFSGDVATRCFKPKVLNKSIALSNEWTLLFAPTWVTEGCHARRLCAFTSERILLWNAISPELELSFSEAEIVFDAGEVLLQTSFFDNRSSNILVGAVLNEEPRVVNKTPDGEEDDFVVDFVTTCELRIWNKRFEVLKILNVGRTESGEVQICTALVCSAFFVYMGDSFGSIYAWKKKSISDVSKMESQCSSRSKHHNGKIVAVDADPHFCYTMGADDAVVVSKADGLEIVCRIDLRDPVVVFNPKTLISTDTLVRSGKHLVRPCSRWAMSQSFPNRRGVTSQGPRGFVFASATNEKQQGLLLKFDLNRQHDLAVQCTLAHPNPVRVCISGPYDNGPLITIGEEETDIHFWDIHSLQLLLVMSVAESTFIVNSIAVHPQECFYSVNTRGQISVWKNRN